MIDEATQDLLSRYLDGDLQDGEWETVESLLAGSAEAREELELLQITLDALKDLPELEAPAGFTDAVLTRVEAEPTVAADDAPPPEEAAPEPQAVVVPLQPRRAARRVWAPFALAAAACLMVGLFWFLGPGLGDKSMTMAEAPMPTTAVESLADGDAVALLDEAAEEELAGASEKALERAKEPAKETMAGAGGLADEITAEFASADASAVSRGLDESPGQAGAVATLPPTDGVPAPPVPAEEPVTAETEGAVEMTDEEDAVADTLLDLRGAEEPADMALAEAEEYGADDGYMEYGARNEEAKREDADEGRSRRQANKSAPAATGGAIATTVQTAYWVLDTDDADILQDIAGRCSPAANCTWRLPAGGVRTLSEGDAEQAVQLQLSYQAYGAMQKALKSRGSLDVQSSPQGLRGKDTVQLTIQVSYRP